MNTFDNKIDMNDVNDEERQSMMNECILWQPNSRQLYNFMLNL